MPPFLRRSAEIPQQRQTLKTARDQIRDEVGAQLEGIPVTQLLSRPIHGDPEDGALFDIDELASYAHTLEQAAEHDRTLPTHMRKIDGDKRAAAIVNDVIGNKVLARVRQKADSGHPLNPTDIQLATRAANRLEPGSRGKLAANYIGESVRLITPIDGSKPAVTQAGELQRLSVAVDVTPTDVRQKLGKAARAALDHVSENGAPQTKPVTPHKRVYLPSTMNTGDAEALSEAALPLLLIAEDAAKRHSANGDLKTSRTLKVIADGINTLPGNILPTAQVILDTIVERRNTAEVDKYHRNYSPIIVGAGATAIVSQIVQQAPAFADTPTAPSKASPNVASLAKVGIPGTETAAASPPAVNTQDTAAILDATNKQVAIGQPPNPQSLLTPIITANNPGVDLSGLTPLQVKPSLGLPGSNLNLAPLSSSLSVGDMPSVQLGKPARVPTAATHGNIALTPPQEANKPVIADLSMIDPGAPQPILLNSNGFSPDQASAIYANMVKSNSSIEDCVKQLAQVAASYDDQPLIGDDQSITPLQRVFLQKADAMEIEAAKNTSLTDDQRQTFRDQVSSAIVLLKFPSFSANIIQTNLISGNQIYLDTVTDDYRNPLTYQATPDNDFLTNFNGFDPDTMKIVGRLFASANASITTDSQKLSQLHGIDTTAEANFKKTLVPATPFTPHTSPPKTTTSTTPAAPATPAPTSPNRSSPATPTPSPEVNHSGVYTLNANQLKMIDNLHNLTAQEKLFYKNLIVGVMNRVLKGDKINPEAVIAQGMHETGDGTSFIAMHGNNIFGTKAAAGAPSSQVIWAGGSEQNPDGSWSSANMAWKKYSNMTDAISDYSLEIGTLSWYQDAMYCDQDPEHYLSSLENKLNQGTCQVAGSEPAWATDHQYIQLVMNRVKDLGVDAVLKAGPGFTINRAGHSAVPFGPQPQKPAPAPAHPAPVKNPAPANTASSKAIQLSHNLNTIAIGDTQNGPFQELGRGDMRAFTADQYETDLNKYGVGFGGSTGYTDCGAYVATVINKGFDSNYPTLGTTTQINYLRSHPELYQAIPNTGSTSHLQAGDIFIVYGHTYIAVQTSGGLKAAEASQYNHAPQIDNGIYFHAHNQNFLIFRPIAR